MSEPKKKVGRPLGPINQPRNRAATQDPKFLAAKIRVADEQSRKLKIANDLAAGKLVDAGAVTREWVSLTTAVRNAMLAVPARLQARIPSLSRADVAVIDEELRAALAALGTAPVEDGSNLI